MWLDFRTARNLHPHIKSIALSLGGDLLFLIAAAFVGLAIVLYQQFIFHMASRYTLAFWLSYFVVLSAMFYFSPIPLPFGALSLGAIAICLGEIGLIHVTRRWEAKSERQPPGSGPLPNHPDTPDNRSEIDRAG